MYVILNWISGDWETINIVREDCEVVGFDTEEEARKYAEDNLNWKWKVVEVD